MHLYECVCSPEPDSAEEARARLLEHHGAVRCGAELLDPIIARLLRICPQVVGAAAVVAVLDCPHLDNVQVGIGHLR